MRLWPRYLLLSNCEGLYLVEDGRDVVVVEQARKPYYGISWRRTPEGAHRLYVAARCGGGTTSTILEFDEGLRCLREFDVPAACAHQALWWRDRLLVTSTESNQVLSVDVETGQSVEVFHTGGKIEAGIASDHINSLWAASEDSLYVLEHRQSAKFDRPSRIRRLTSDYRMELELSLGDAAHNIYVEGPRWFLCDSLDQSLRILDWESQAMTRIPLGAFTRGLSRTTEGFVVGLTDEAPRGRRASSATALALLDESPTFVDRRELAITGGVHGVRALGEVDRAHSVEAFPYLGRKALP